MLDDLKNKIEALRSIDFENELEKIIENNSSILVGLQQGQWSQGTDRNDQPTTLDDPMTSGGRRDYYSIFTYNYKKLHGSGLGAITDYVTGFMTGELYRNTTMSMQNKEITFQSSVPYWTDLLERTGEDWPGIDPVNRLQFAQKYVVPGINLVFKERMGF
jgi:hypothetical protein